jgi:hypothetical protein
MKRVILTIAIVLGATSVFADDHHRDWDRHDNGRHYGHYKRHDTYRGQECRHEREWQPGYVIYRPEQRRTEPRVSVSIWTPAVMLSFLTGR